MTEIAEIVRGRNSDSLPSFHRSQMSELRHIFSRFINYFYFTIFCHVDVKTGMAVRFLCGCFYVNHPPPLVPVFFVALLMRLPVHT
jgi:hypothetical protein